MVEDRHQVAVVEPSGLRGDRQRRIDPLGAQNVRQLDGLVHLAPDPRDAGGGGLGQPPAGSLAQHEEVDLGFGAGPRFGHPQHRPAVGVVRVVLVDNPGIAGRGEPVPRDLGGPQPVQATITSSSPETGTTPCGLGARPGWSSAHCPS